MHRDTIKKISWNTLSLHILAYKEIEEEQVWKYSQSCSLPNLYCLKINIYTIPFEIFLHLAVISHLCTVTLDIALWIWMSSDRWKLFPQIGPWICVENYKWGRVRIDTFIHDELDLWFCSRMSKFVQMLLLHIFGECVVPPLLCLNSKLQ